MTDSPIDPPKPNRRSFIKWSIFGLLSAFFVTAANVIIRYLIPPPPAKRAKSLAIPTEQIGLGASLVVEFKGGPVILIHTEEGFAAFSAVCTHLGCLVKWSRSEKIFYCPCHAGKFDRTGKVLAGPPPEPLHRVPIKIEEDNIIFV